MNELFDMGAPAMGMGGTEFGQGFGQGFGQVGVSPAVQGSAPQLDEETMALLQQLAVQDPGAYQQMMAELGLPPEVFMPAGRMVQGGQPTGMPNPADQRSDMTWQALLQGNPSEGEMSPIVDRVARQLGLYDNTSDAAVMGADPYNQGPQLDDSIMQLLGGGAY